MFAICRLHYSPRFEVNPAPSRNLSGTDSIQENPMLSYQFRLPVPISNSNFPAFVAISLLRTFLVLVILMLLPNLVHASGTVLLGSQSVARSRDTDPPGSAEAFQFAATASGTVSTLTVYIDSSSGATQLIVGIYASSGQNPGALLGQGSIASPTGGAWNTVSISPVTVTAGTVYWISILGTGGTLAFRDSGANCISQSSAQANLTSLPSTWSVGSRWFSCTLSAYGSSSSTSPIVSVSPSSISFSATQGSSTNPAPATANVSNSGSGSLTFAANSDSTWLSVSPSSGTAPQSLQVSAAVGSLSSGTYTGHITLSSAGAQGSPATITVTFNVSAPALSPVLSVSPVTLAFNSVQGSTTNPSPSNLSVGNTGGGALVFTVTSDSSWLSAAPNSGNAPQTLQVSAVPGTLLAGTYVGHLTVSSSGVAGSPATVTATLVVAAP